MNTLADPRMPARRHGRRLGLTRARVVAALSSIALLAAMPAAAHAVAWLPGPEFAVPSPALGGDFAEAPDGSSTAAWYSITNTQNFSTQVQVQHASPDDVVGAPVTLGTGVFPVIATSPSNRTAVAWVEQDPGGGAGEVHVTLFDAAGVEQHDVSLEALTADQASHTPIDVAIDASGDTTVVWTREITDAGGNVTDEELDAAHVAPDGSHSTPVTLGHALGLSARPATPDGFDPQVAMAPDGTAWVAWVAPDPSPAVTVTVHAARLSPSGAVDVPDTALTASAQAPLFSLSASAGGAAIAWLAPTLLDPSLATEDIDGMRLPATGSLTGAPFRAAGAAGTANPLLSLQIGPGFDVAVGPDGVVSLAWMQPLPGGLGATTVLLSRFVPGQSSADASRLGDQASGALTLAPALAAAPDGSMVVTWSEAEASDDAFIGARVAPDGTIGPASRIGTANPNNSVNLGPLPFAIPQADNLGSGMAGAVSYGPPQAGELGFWQLSTTRLDATGPIVTANVPTSAVALAPVIFNGTVSPSNVRLVWDFGDGSSSTGLQVSHVYAAPGDYTVTATATATDDDATVVTRHITVTAPATGGPGLGAAPAPAPAVPGPSTTRRAAATLKVARATRSGARVTVSGTINRRAHGKVSIVYAQKVGHRTIRVRRTVAIAKGRWGATLTLPRSLTRGRASRGRASVTATFVGTTIVKRAAARHAVSLAKVRTAKGTGTARKRHP